MMGSLKGVNFGELDWDIPIKPGSSKCCLVSGFGGYQGNHSDIYREGGANHQPPTWILPRLRCWRDVPSSAFLHNLIAGKLNAK